MTFEEQMAEAMKNSLEELDKPQEPESPKEEEPKFEDKVESDSEQPEEDLYSDDKKPEDPHTPVETPKPVEEPKKVCVVEEVDPTALANTAQLMAIFNVPENRKEDVQKWVNVKSKSGITGINELLNLFLDEMSGRF